MAQLTKGIVFQTNILALNAAVEAARAGKSGRGFRGAQPGPSLHHQRHELSATVEFFKLGE